jgi:hypothetical protein
MTKLEFNETSGQWDISGMFPDLLNLLSSSMNFTYTLTPPPDNQWGGQQPDGLWNGMMGLVETHCIKLILVFARPRKDIYQTLEDSLSLIAYHIIISLFRG